MIENEMTVSVPLEVVKASEIEPKEVKWLWYPYIPFGKVTLLQGDPGDGKSKLNHFSLKCCREEKCFLRIVKKNLKPQGSRNRPSKRQRRTQELFPERKVFCGTGLCRWAIYRENKCRLSADGTVCFYD